MDQHPPSTRGFKGRTEELAQIFGWLNDERTRLVGIVSAGGFGKSTLAAKIYQEASGFERKFWLSFEQPYRFVQFGRWLLEQFGVNEVDEAISENELINKINNHLFKTRCLLVLDNLESLLQDRQWQEAAYQTFFQKWMQQQNDSVVLLTSREQPRLLQQQTVGREWRRLKGLSDTAGIEHCVTRALQATSQPCSNW